MFLIFFLSVNIQDCIKEYVVCTDVSRISFFDVNDTSMLTFLRLLSHFRLVDKKRKGGNPRAK